MMTHRTGFAGFLTVLGMAGAAFAENLTMDFYHQVNNYFCGPTTTQIVVKYFTGRKVNVYTIAAFENTSPSSGTTSFSVCRGINRFAQTNYVVAQTFNRSRAVLNIQRGTPVPINVKTKYLNYWRGIAAKHYCTVKGYTRGGFYIHDSGWRNGANKWASTVEVTNAVNYHAGRYLVRY